MLIRKTPISTQNSNSIYSLEPIQLGNIKQTILIRSDDTTKPILLFLHGGPGTAQIGFARKYQRNLEKEFIVVNWDQRGSGLSQPDGLTKEDLTLEKYLSDAKELITHLLYRFGKEKLYLVGHSWGTILGTELAKTYSDYLYAYIGIGQIVNMYEGEKASYEFVVRQAKDKYDRKALKILEHLEFDPNSMDYLMKQRKLLDRFKGSTYSVSGFQMYTSDFFSIKEYKVSDWFKYFEGNSFSVRTMWNEVMKTDFSGDTHFAILIYFCAGRYDYNTPSPLAEAYFKTIEAPKKEFLWFENSAHCPPFEEPEKFNAFCIRIAGKDQ